MSPEFKRDVILAEAACMGGDGGMPPGRIGDCVITCTGEYGEARLLDGGACYVPEPLVPVRGGDLWLPGQLPLKRNLSR